ncbi:uncharacterized protein LOC111710528 [Eurytemora carolleeae]|uniref:uncharacterized protein LOC111710528 n=1 Tax=Eurytemora carolleeae TaxID=1294199 RepID=UPI000C76555D|nr:uncharacterized protein LOC111710528 [Eurytemora carolleeae]|eukprot:XP_023340398.1 uncharacterized protein LOC111710528 [Eurytemora affinis]
MLLLYLERCLVLVLAVVALLLAVVSFRGLVPLQDPVSSLGYIDKLSLLFGLHEQSHVLIVSSNQWSSDVLLYTFQKRLKDGAFFLSQESSGSSSSSLLENISQESIESKCDEILTICNTLVPFTANRNNIPILVGLPDLRLVSREEQKTVVSTLDSCFSNSDFDYTREGSIGIISTEQQTVMQWFALSLLNGRLPFMKPGETPVLAETNEDDLIMTFAVSSMARVKNSTVLMHKKVEVFGEIWDLVTVCTL